MSPILRICAHYGCTQTIPERDRYCAAHAPLMDENVRRGMKRRRYGYHRTHWRTLRLQCLMLVGGVCQLQLPGCSGKATHVHLDPKLEGNHDIATIDDCTAVCAQCSGAVDAPRSHLIPPRPNPRSRDW